MRPLLPLLVLVACVGCATRERANPFDPQNPATQGRPAGFVALAADQRVSLSWQPVAGENLVGYQLFRRRASETDFTPLAGTLPLAQSSFQDLGLINGEDVFYRCYFVFASGLGARFAEDVAAPGAVLPWVVDIDRQSLIRLTPDGRRIAFERGGLLGPNDVDVTPDAGTVWIADELAGTLVIFQPNSQVTVTVSGLSIPVAVAVDPRSNTAWVCDRGQNLVLHYRSTGDEATLPIAPLAQPVDVAVDPFDQSVWVWEYGGNRVDRFRSDGARLGTIDVSLPTRIAVDSLTHRAWVSAYDLGRVYKLTSTGVIEATLTGFVHPLGVALDSRRGRIWVADPSAATVIALRRDGTEEFRVTGLPDAREIAVDLDSGEAWVTLAGPGQIARLSPSGTVLRVVAGLGTPAAIAVDPS